MSSSDTYTIAAWNNTSAAVNRYFSIFIFLFGTIGNILNILVLSQRPLRTNSCSLFFLISSIANLIAIVSGLTTRMLSGWTLDLTNTISLLCKLRAFALFVSRNIASWLIMLAAIDRWLISSRNVRRRELSTLKNAYRGIMITIIFSIILYSPVFYCHEANLINAPLKCYSQTIPCRLLNDLSYACLTILFPMIFMLIFGLMTIHNINKVKNRIYGTSIIELKPMGNTSILEQPTQSSKKKLDSRLFFMLFIQIILLSLCTLPQAIQKLYSTLLSNDGKTQLRIAIENFIFNLFLLMTYFAHGMPFYIYTLSGGTVFRNALKHYIEKIYHRFF
ncbi:unnamed protein product [Rotaria sp. Silwood1]|nr:unnamed protein product [Rotaria sp. Silwood1]CAF4860993.1 unnamed protein product [Rotaria sp. Silwood1]CAF4867376.1 unnamed protein product [Rotaria sp. Silwood1]